MADLFYSLTSKENPEKYAKLYSDRKEIAEGFSIYSNRQIEEYSSDNKAAYIIGTAVTLNEDKREFILNILSSFSEESVPEIQKRLVGQYILIIKNGSCLYLIPDFLHVRNLYFDESAKEIASSIGALSAYSKKQSNEFMDYEFAVMQKCIYPQWLGNSTNIDTVSKLMICQYLELNLASNEFNIKNFSINFDNIKEDSSNRSATANKKILESIIGNYSESHAVSTITGGYDSRLISALCAKQISDLTLRIAAPEGAAFRDLSIGKKVASALKKNIVVYPASLDRDVECFVLMTDGMSPKENSIITSLAKQSSEYEIGFGGTLGTEIYSTLRYTSTAALVNDFNRIASLVYDNKEFLSKFDSDLRNEIDFISSHCSLEVPEERDLVHIIWAVLTARFSSPIVSAFDIYGHQIEPFATYSILQESLKISYEYQGDQKTHGRFYLIPKMIMKSVSKKVGMIDSTHNAPLLPVSLFTLPLYIIGKIR